MATVTVANPRKRKRRKKRRNPAPVAANPRRRRRRRNPAVATIANPRRRRRRSNPRPSIKYTFMEALKAAGPVILGIYGTRYGTRAILKNNDFGFKGYGGNLVAAILLSMLASMAGKRKAAGLIAAGGFAATGLRVLVDKFPGYTGGYTQFADYAPDEGQALQQYPNEQFQGNYGDYVQGAAPLQGMGIPELDLPAVGPDEYGYGGQVQAPDYWGVSDYLQPG